MSMLVGIILTYEGYAAFLRDMRYMPLYFGIYQYAQIIPFNEICWAA